jgi:hypothetical protein
MAGDIPAARARSERAIEIGRGVGDTPSELDGRINLGLAKEVEGDLDGGMALLREAAQRALEARSPWHADRALHNVWAGLARYGGDVSDARKAHDDALAAARRSGLRSEAMVHREAWNAVEDADWDRALAVIEGGRADTFWSSGRDAWVELIRTARHGPHDYAPMLAAARRLATATPDVNARAAAAFPAITLHLAEDWPGTLEIAMLGLEPLADGSYPMPHTAAVVAIDAALRMDDASAIDRWLESASVASRTKTRHEEIRKTYADAVRSTRRGDRAMALASFARYVELAERTIGWVFIARLGRLARAELLAKGGDRSAAQDEIDRAATFWRTGMATWYLGRLAEWARERGLALAV